MKLYEEDGYIYLDYTDVDPALQLNAAAMEYRDFMSECRHELGVEWDRTLKPKVKQINMHYDRIRGDCTATGTLRWRLSRMQAFAKYGRWYLDIDESFKEFKRKVDERFVELWEAENVRAAERKRGEEWKRLQKLGCGRCSECRCVGDDDYECGATGENLEIRNVPEYRGKVYQLFNYVPFPSENCPYNINKTKEVI